MTYYNDGHTALESKVLVSAESADLKLVLVKRYIDKGKEEIVVHGKSTDWFNRVTSNVILQAVGFHRSIGVCPYFIGDQCFYRSFPINTPIDLNLMVAKIAQAVPKLREIENALNRCGWSMFRDLLRPIGEGHYAAQKQVIKSTDDANFKFVLTYINDQYNEGKFVTHYIPKQAHYSPEMLAALNFLEMKRFEGCPESDFQQCFYTTYDNPKEREFGFNRPADNAHSYFDQLPNEFSKICSSFIETDASLREVGLHFLEIPHKVNINPSGLKVSKVNETKISMIPGTITNKSIKADAFQWDVFISHASEDKEKFVRKLAEELISNGVRVWYDESTLKIGDSLRRSIENGLIKSRYGIVILSPNFFAKKWPQDELNGLVVKERNGQKVILPVWLEIDFDTVAKFSPILADRVAAKVVEGMDKVLADLLTVILPG